MSYAALVRAMSAAGAPPEAIALALEALEAKDTADRTRKDQARDKKRKQRAAARGEVVDGVGTVPGPSRDTAGTVPPIPAPAPPPLSSPQTPQQTPPPHPHPDSYSALTRGLAGIGMVVAGCEQLRAKAAPPKAHWPKDMPPPQAVTAEQWAGYLAHRRAKREPLTPRAYQLLCRKLERHADDEWPPGRIVDQMVERNWISFEPAWLPRGTDTHHGNRPRHDRRDGWAARPGMEGVEPAYLPD